MPPFEPLIEEARYKCQATAIAFGIIIVCLLTVLGLTVGHVSLTPAEFARMIGLAVVGVIPFACMGMAMALLVPFNAAPGVTNMIYLPMSFCGGLWVPLMFLPHFMQTIAVLMPTYHLGQLMLGAFGYASTGTT